MIDSLPGVPEMPEVSVRVTARFRKGVFAFLLVFTCVIFAPIYLIISPGLFGSYQYSPIDNYTNANVTIIPLPNSEIWLEDDEKLWIYGSILVISNNMNVEWLDVHGIQIPLTENDSIIVDTSTLGRQSGITYLIMSNGTTIEWIDLTISSASLENTRLINTVLVPVLLLLFSLGVIRGLGGKILSVDIDKSYELIGNQSTSFIPSQKEEKIEYFIRRTDLIREALNSKLKDANESANRLASLYLAIATGLVGVIYFIVPIPLQLGTKAFFILFCILSIVYCGMSVLILFGSRTERQMSDRTPWDSRWNIYRNAKGVDRFKADTTRIYRDFNSWSEKKIFAENVREIRYLYECNSDTERKTSRMRKGIWFPLYAVGMGTAMVLMDVMDPLYMAALMVLFLGVSIFVQIKGEWRNLGELKIQRRFVIYYSSNHTNQNLPQNQDFEMKWEYLAPLGVLLEDTSNYTQNDLTALRDAARSIYEQSGRKPDSTKLFGPTPGSFDSCGREVPVFIINTRGEINSNEIFPQENDNLTTTIIDALKTKLDNGN